MSTESRPPTNYVYVVQLGLISLLLGIVGWFSIATVNDVKSGVSELVKTTTEMKVEMRALKSTMDAWTALNFVSRELFDAAKTEYDRRIAALEKTK